MTVSITTNFLAPALGALQARGRVVRAGRSLVTAEATLFDVSGEPVAQALATLRVTRP
jgi:acyl-coenzyme A thioesterase PaaI-like protein